MIHKFCIFFIDKELCTFNF